MNDSPVDVVIRAFKAQGVRWILSVACRALDQRTGRGGR
jgi:hypothetical protein